jgi:hypothetical protein
MENVDYCNNFEFDPNKEGGVINQHRANDRTRLCFQANTKNGSSCLKDCDNDGCLLNTTKDRAHFDRMI